MNTKLRRQTFVCILLMWSFCAGAFADERNEHLELLAEHGIGTKTPQLLAYLQRLQPSDDLQREITTLIKQLSDSDFATRESAFKKLPTFGEAARKQLGEATKSKDPEVSWRAGKILKELDSEDESRRRESITLAALSVLRSRGEANSAPTILATIPLLGESHTRDAACQALWACVDESHINLLRAELANRDKYTRAASIVGLEKAAEEKALPKIAPLLTSEDQVIRLAAARALVDHRPQESIRALVELTGEEDDVAWQADALLQLKTGQRMEPADGESLRDAWERWESKERASAKLVAELGEKRYDLSVGRNALDESFARSQKKLDEGYGKFLYEADNGGTAKVADGKLRIDGDNAEGDQRLYITSERMIGRDRWPDKLEVRAHLAGEAGNNFGWHMGVSVGRVKVLFHPGYSNGAFRAEMTDTHDYIFGNEDLSFAPANGVMHEMTIQVAKTEAGAEFYVTMKPVGDGRPFERKFTVNDQQLGDYNRIGLERSGRTGGDALFDSVSIRLGR